ncbi:LamG-like jellyroll fold domain-containing protein [Flammeovirga agarivorans]|uniref:T9SS type A sorting domain-containing protein n=1 Tax=Flammeovirga agarivorans TaxID=2726742 RepID=A0A7X8SQU9_9BACT|nr:LamG-like jellyroll fold domain-containing protein [Flammeovirga agarivorans]NLR94614.1 T9SS type A sorting domain-containing protein [Flammeovirga agarivorans]
MKNIYFILLLIFGVVNGRNVLAQDDEFAPKVFTGSGGNQQRLITSDGSYIDFQIGSPIMLGNMPHNSNSISLGFPYNRLYAFPTFSHDGFEVSKGYYGDKILIQWEVFDNNQDITNFKIYRRVFDDNNVNDEDNFVEIAQLASDVYEYEDPYVDGSVIYEYKLQANGISAIPKEFLTYITGVGYRNPTAIVSGNISFEGGNPVKDVVVRAEPEGSIISVGSSVEFDGSGYLTLNLTEDEISDSLTIQSWFKTATTSVSGTLFELEPLSSSVGNYSLKMETSSSDINFIVADHHNYTYEIHLEDSLPSGLVDGRGADILLPIDEILDQFNNISLVLKENKAPLLYLNGRLMNEEYNATLPEEYIGPTITITDDNNWTYAAYKEGSFDVFVGEGFSGNIDEFRYWKRSLTDAKVRADFRRYLGGDEADFVAYIRMDEANGEYAYDLSKVSFEFNKNHATIINGTWSDVIPTASQLGVYGITDEYGNYVISAIPYSGNGASYTIIPMFGVHEFDPIRQVTFLGKGSEVANGIDFSDISAFIFKGVVMYDVTNVFDPIETLSDVIQIQEEGYNQYRVTTSSGERLLNKADYYAPDINGTVIYDQPNVFLEGANIYIDGELVLDENKNPVETESDGSFNISVPIGDHFIEVKKNNHTLVHAGRFPSTGFFEFFEHQESQRVFVDTTKVTVVGRVTGGAVESSKEIGFGYDGSVHYEFYSETDSAYFESVSSINNIGSAKITFSYLPEGADPVTGSLKHQVTTNDETGEYRVELLPLSYGIEADEVVIPSNTNLRLLSLREEVDFSEVIDPVMSEFKDDDDNILLLSNPYQYVQSFSYRSTPEISVLSQESEEIVTIEGVDYDTEGFEFPVYSQFQTYGVELYSYEKYENFDVDPNNPVRYDVPVVDGEFIINNNLALDDSESLTVRADDQSKALYTFRAGAPSVSLPFTKNINIKLRVKNIDYEPISYLKEGIILGGQSDGSQTFVTAAPDIPDIILRDPPGSNSFATIEAGESFTFSKTLATSSSIASAMSSTVSMGADFKIGGGLAGPVVEIESTLDYEYGIGVEVSSDDASTITKTYTFSQAISTSDDPNYVGADGDLYIGQSMNYYYGTYDNIEPKLEAVDGRDVYTLTNTNGDKIYVNKMKAMYFNEEPSETLFIYSQNHILGTLIPELELIVENIDNGSVDPDNTPGMLSRAEYVQQIDLWQKIVQNNERTKYMALSEREALKTELFNTTLFLEQGDDFYDFADNNFSENISYDAGVGELTRTIETVKVTGDEYEYTVAVDALFATTVGLETNGIGFEGSVEASAANSETKVIGTENEETLTVSYTFIDQDDDNFLSVDVINTFDGNGPVFSTIGGRTSCPYEDAAESEFYVHDGFDPNVLGEGGEQLSYATQKVEDPMISVEVASLTDINESGQAEFLLYLENNSASESDVNFQLLVDNTTNPNSAELNIQKNGEIVYIPYGQKVPFALTLKKTISDVYEYEDIRIILASLCDDIGDLNVYDEVYVSASFVPSCSMVQIDLPLDNWVKNTTNTYNDDGTVNGVPIQLSGYNRTFQNFDRIELEYRKSTSPSWTRLKSYYNAQEDYDYAESIGKSNIELITENTIHYTWDITDPLLDDGSYEVRAISYCKNGTEFTSDIISGTIDLNTPVVFGTPTPSDGILNVGEDLKVQFNENIIYNSAISKIEITGETNQQDVKHNVSVYFTGESNTLFLENPPIKNGDLSIEFWMNNATVAGNATIFSQVNGTSLTVSGTSLTWNLGGESVTGIISNDGLFHHYTLTYDDSNGKMAIYQDDTELDFTVTDELEIINSNPLIIGGNTFIGNIHDFRIWDKFLSLSVAYSNMYSKLVGSEVGLKGFWPMNEGQGELCYDKARNRHGIMGADWDIKPKGTSYAFDGIDYLTLDNVDYVQLTSEMDVTLSFWIKADEAQESTIFSNGRGNGEDIIQANGAANKWSVDLTTDGKLYLENEGTAYELTHEIIDGGWHHIAMILTRQGTLKTYVDAELISSNAATGISGFSGNMIWIGARGYYDGGSTIVDRQFKGHLDEVRLWNTARTKEQITRDAFNEVDYNTTGLMLYLDMNAPDPLTSDGPTYYHAFKNETVISTKALIPFTNTFSDDAPKIKPSRELESFEIYHVINGDELLLSPIISNYAVLEGQTVDITVHRMFDEAGNLQQSPITWTAYVRRNEVSWYVGDETDYLSIEKQVGTSSSFEITIANEGGKDQPFFIENIPTWLTLSETGGTLSPDSKKVITATIDPNLSIGQYNLDLYLNTDYDYDEKVKLDLRVFEVEPEWSVDPIDYAYNMNIIGKIKIDGVFSEDSHTKIGAFVNGEPRGEASLAYDEFYDDYFVFLGIYSNEISGEDIEFRIWDALAGKALNASINDLETIEFINDQVIGYKTNPAIFEDTNIVQQTIVLNDGWTWLSFFVDQESFSDINTMTAELDLTNQDRIYSQTYFDTYDSISGWTGTLSAFGGLNAEKMYKIKLEKENILSLEGHEIDLEDLEVSLKEGWNWLSYPLAKNMNVNDALAHLEASNGDILKSQHAFAIYDQFSGWTGSLNYLEDGIGYMLKTQNEQSFTYPSYLSNARTHVVSNHNNSEEVASTNFVLTSYPTNMNAVVLVDDEVSQVIIKDVNGNIRGIAPTNTIEDRKLAFITMFADNEEHLKYYIEVGEKEIETEKELQFQSDALLGTIAQPVDLRQGNYAEEMNVYPVPFDKKVSVSLFHENEEKANVSVLDINGKVMLSSEMTLQKGANQWDMSLNLSSGVYLIHITTPSKTYTKRIVK